MANYQSETGIIFLKKSNFNLLLLLLKTKYNQDMEKAYEVTLYLYEELNILKTQNKTNFDLYEEIKKTDDFLSRNQLISDYEPLILSELFRKECFVTNMFDEKYFKSENKFRLFKPRKNKFKKLNNKIKSFDFQLSGQDLGSIELDFEQLKAEWNVLYCNGRVKEMRESENGLIFHDFLKNAPLGKKEVYSLEETSEYDEEY